MPIIEVMSKWCDFFVLMEYLVFYKTMTKGTCPSNICRRTVVLMHNYSHVSVSGKWVRFESNRTQHNTTQHNTTRHDINTTRHDTTQHDTTRHNSCDRIIYQNNTKLLAVDMYIHRSYYYSGFIITMVWKYISGLRQKGGISPYISLCILFWNYIVLIFKV